MNDQFWLYLVYSCRRQEKMSIFKGSINGIDAFFNHFSKLVSLL
jgi:hypothetical protein